MSELESLFRTFANAQFRMGADEHVEGLSDRLCKKHYDEANSAEDAFLNALRAELADLRRDRERLRSALRRARDWSVSSHGYECRQSIIMAEWIDGGMVGDLPPLPAYLSAAMPAPLPECVQPRKTK